MSFASPADIELCRQVHKKFGTTYYYATLRFPARIRRHVHAIYGFVRIADEWVDNPGELSPQEQRANLEDWRQQLVLGLAGECPSHWAMRAFCDTVRECKIPVEEAHFFIDAMIQDIDQAEYPTYADLCDYMRGSASAVGVMMCYAMDAPTDEDTLARAKALGEAMQMTNFLRDVGEDLRDRRRVYLPQEDLARFGVTHAALEAGVVTPEIEALLKFEIERTRELYRFSDAGTYRLPRRMRKAVLVARILYSDILGRIEANGYDVFTKRARTSRRQKLLCAARVVADDERVLTHLVTHG
ncbi:MAG: phytoene/squalene synthase family protein [Fimbriimonas sp.]|nr:phytoene/squalene synthase family protein [Fimbriimonas sp.]